MDIYTSYFAKLRSIDMSNKIAVSISLWPPRGYAGPSLPRLAPTESILREYKAHPDWPRYVRRFRDEVLSGLYPHDIVSEILRIAEGRDVLLCCFEKDPAQCHRSLVAEWLNRAGYHVGEWP